MSKVCLAVRLTTVSLVLLQSRKVTVYEPLFISISYPSSVPVQLIIISHNFSFSMHAVLKN